LENFQTFITELGNLVWGTPLLILLVGSGRLQRPDGFSNLVGLLILSGVVVAETNKHFYNK
jgi:Na+/alanine symporter